MAAPISLVKVLLFLDLFSLIEFGNYSLSLLYGGFFSYILALGNHEGLIKKLTLISASEDKELIKNFLSQSSISYLLTAIPLVLISVSFLYGFGFLDFYYSVLAISTGLSISACNLISVKWKVYGNFKVFGLFNFTRLLLLTTPLIYSYLIKPIEIVEILIIESFIAIFIPVLTSIYLGLIRNLNLEFFRKEYINVLKVGLPLSLGALTKQMIFTIERTVAKLNLNPDDFGLYSAYMIIFQVLIILGGIVATPLQREVIFKKEEIGAPKTRLHLMLVHIMGICLLLLFFTFLSFMPFNDLGYNNSFNIMTGVIFMIVLGSGLIAFSFYDSLVLAQGNGVSYLKRILSYTFLILIFFMTPKYYFEIQWNMIYQALFFMFLMFGLSLSSFNSALNRKLKK